MRRKILLAMFIKAIFINNRRISDFVFYISENKNIAEIRNGFTKLKNAIIFSYGMYINK